MKNILFLFTGVLPLFLFPDMLYAQVKSSIAEVKTLKKGVYNGSYILPNGNLGIFFYEKGELASYEFSPDAQYNATYHGNEANTLLNTAHKNESTDVNSEKAIKIAPNGYLDVMIATSGWIGTKIFNAQMYLTSTDKFIGDIRLEEKDKRKIKVGDDHNVTFFGARAIIPQDKLHYEFNAHNGKTRPVDFSRASSAAIAPKGGALQSAGVIFEKISIKSPSPYNNNRLAVFKTDFDGNETSNIHIMPYSMQNVGIGSDAQNNMVVMTMPVNAPSTYAPHKPLRAKDEDRENLYIYQFDTENNLVKEHSLKSGLLRVNYQTAVAGNKTLIIGVGSTKGSGYRATYYGKMDGFSIVVLDENNTLSVLKTYSGNDFLNKVVVATGGKAGNMTFPNGGPLFYSSSVLDNGNIFLFGKSDNHHHGALLSAGGELIKYYIFPHLDPKKHKNVSEQIEIKGNKIYVLIADQPNELSNDIKTSTHTTSYVAGGYKVTTTNTRTTQLLEVFHLSNVYMIDGNSGANKFIQLNKEVKGFYTLGTTPALFTEKGIYIPGRIKANKGKEISLIKIDY